jgi:uncharacterized protein
MSDALPTHFWTDDEVRRLGDYLVRDDGPKNTMGVSMLDGFLCAVVSGPALIMPGEMLRWVTDTEHGSDPPVFESAEEAREITELIMRQWNAISEALTHDPGAYEPLLIERQADPKVVRVFDEWCAGYYKGMELDLENWLRLMADRPDLLAHIVLYGTPEGRDKLKHGKLPAREHEAIADSLGERARAIHAHWLAQRRADRDAGRLPEPIFRREPVRREGPKIGRNDPCPCGSGRKFKLCHGAA